MRKLAAVAVFAAVVALVGSTVALAKDHELVQWTIPAGQCGDIPADLVLTGIGTSKTKDTFKSKDEGVVTESFRETVRGTATDNHGGRYRFNYVQTFDASSPGTGVLHDHFDLSGDGEANIVAEFKIDFVFGDDWALIDEVFTQIVGDSENCDPI